MDVRSLSHGPSFLQKSAIPAPGVHAAELCHKPKGGFDLLFATLLQVPLIVEVPGLPDRGMVEDEVVGMDVCVCEEERSGWTVRDPCHCAFDVRVCVRCW